MYKFFGIWNVTTRAVLVRLIKWSKHATEIKVDSYTSPFVVKCSLKRCITQMSSNQLSTRIWFVQDFFVLRRLVGLLSERLATDNCQRNKSWALIDSSQSWMDWVGRWCHFRKPSSITQDDSPRVLLTFPRNILSRTTQVGQFVRSHKRYYFHIDSVYIWRYVFSDPKYILYQYATKAGKYCVTLMFLFSSYYFSSRNQELPSGNNGERSPRIWSQRSDRIGFGHRR